MPCSGRCLLSTCSVPGAGGGDRARQLLPLRGLLSSGGARPGSMDFPWIRVKGAFSAVGTQPVLLGLTLRILHLVVSVGFKETAAPGRHRLAPHLRPFPALAGGGCQASEALPRLCARGGSGPGLDVRPCPVTRTNSSRETLSLSAWFSVAKKRTPGGWGRGPQQPHSVIITKTLCLSPETEDSGSGPD